MPKKIVEDVLPPPRRSIRNVPLSDSKIIKERKPRARRSSAFSDSPTSSTENITRSEITEEKAQFEIENVVTTPEGTIRRRRLLVWGGVTVAFVCLIYFSSVFFVRASVEIVPKQWTADVNTSFNTVDYNLITVSEEVSRVVPATGTEEVKEKASGDIIIYNNHSSASQALIKNTRFQTPTGKIFRIQDAVTVPGKKTIGAQSTPGSLRVRVYADVAGPEHNVGLADFTIPGFAGDARFKNITAKSDPQSPIHGGFVGMVKKAKEADVQAASVSMEKELTAMLKSRALTQTPSDKVFFGNGAKITFENVALASGAGEESGNSKSIRKKATLVGALFDKEKIVAEFAKAGSFPKEAPIDPLEVENIESLSFSFKDKSESGLSSSEPIKFDLIGKINIIAKVDSDALRTALVGKKASDFSQIISSNPSVSSAKLKMYPGWVRSLPRSADRINIEIEP
ncbi:MAG: hypothetical protein AAB726_00440 [Patescibacteria group bacterium]